MQQLNDPHHLDPSDPHNLQGSEEPVLERIEIATEGENCDECVEELREPLMRIKGVTNVRVETDSQRIVVEFDARKTNPPELHDSILKSGYRPAPMAG